MASSSSSHQKVADEHRSMASSSSSHQRNVDHSHHAFSGIEPDSIRRKVEESSRLFHVFINHRGPDVKRTLALQLYKSLSK
ncbi:hypothetical protein SUGI_0949820 [Cryptomeria japonica]|nr:hypothetical protein SUGI_0949820 [Cryptomeria japonica]